MNARHLLRRADRFLDRLLPGTSGDRPSLLILAFHSLIAEGTGDECGSFDPFVNHGITDQVFLACVDDFQRAGYRFVSPQDLLGGLDPCARHVMLTFDDGYSNNRRALPVLEHYRIPAVFFITARNVRERMSFWWDVIWRERRQRGWSAPRILREQAALKHKDAQQIDAYISRLFGPQAFAVRSEQDAPFTPQELRSFAAHRYVHIGNHTMSHSRADSSDPCRLREQVSSAQEYLASLTPSPPLIFAYPDGRLSAEAVCAVKECGIPLAVTLGWHKNYLPLSTEDDGLLKLARFVVNGHDDPLLQCGLFRSDRSLYGFLKRLLRG